MTVSRVTEIPAQRTEAPAADGSPAESAPVQSPADTQRAPQQAERRARWEHFLEPVEDEPSREAAARRTCDRCGKPLPVGEPVVAVRLPMGGYAIQDQWCGRSRRLWRRRG